MNQPFRCLPRLILFAHCLCFALMAQAQSWVPFHGGTNGSVRALLTDTTNGWLYVAGTFNQAGGAPSNCISRWNGSQWDDFSTSSPSCPNPSDVLALYNGTLYAEGNFGFPNNTKLGRWNGTQWDSVATVDAILRGLTTHTGKLIAYGNFQQIGGIVAPHIAAYDGTTWTTIGSLQLPPSGQLYTSLSYQGDLIVGGTFQDSTSTVKNLASWDGNNWSSIGWVEGPIGGSINALAVLQGDLIVGGSFNTIDGQVMRNLARWDGTNWHSLGGGTSFGGVSEMLVIENELFVTGLFDSVGTIAAEGVAKWDGSGWCNLLGQFSNQIDPMANYKDTLVVGGAFQQIDGQSVPYLSRWTSPSIVDTCESGVGIMDWVLPQGHLNVFPNPVQASSTLTVGAFPPHPHRAMELRWFNALGQLVHQSSAFAEDLTQLALPPNLVYGTYLLHLQQQGWQASGRVVVFP